jgi:hypothetical protein
MLDPLAHRTLVLSSLSLAMNLVPTIAQQDVLAKRKREGSLEHIENSQGNDLSPEENQWQTDSFSTWNSCLC